MTHVDLNSIESKMVLAAHSSKISLGPDLSLKVGPGEPNYVFNGIGEAEINQVNWLLHIAATNPTFHPRNTALAMINGVDHPGQPLDEIERDLLHEARIGPLDFGVFIVTNARLLSFGWNELEGRMRASHSPQYIVTYGMEQGEVMSTVRADSGAVVYQSDGAGRWLASSEQEHAARSSWSEREISDLYWASPTPS